MQTCWPQLVAAAARACSQLTAHMYSKSWQAISCLGSKMTKWLASAVRWCSSLDWERSAYEKSAEEWQKSVVEIQASKVKASGAAGQVEVALGLARQMKACGTQHIESRRRFLSHASHPGL